MFFFLFHWFCAFKIAFVEYCPTGHLLMQQSLDTLYLAMSSSWYCVKGFLDYYSEVHKIWLVKLGSWLTIEKKFTSILCYLTTSRGRSSSWRRFIVQKCFVLKGLLRQREGNILCIKKVIFALILIRRSIFVNLQTIFMWRYNQK